uniref:Uncharacterized protein n=1 Tax=Hyaloperonospora arabidopsidis (strain Emoy2) TaxID=559515 RepID=M4B8V9_HYAAE
MAKRAVVKDRRVFEIVGYPKKFEQLEQLDEQGAPIEFKPSEGSFKITGDKGSLMVYYRQSVHEQDDDSSDIVTFDELGVEREDGTRFSALESFLQNQGVVTHQKSESLGKKMFVPVIGGLLIGGVASFFAIRILRNRPFYVHKLVLDHVNNHETARQLIGHPIKSDRSNFVGVLTTKVANYTIPCSGPKGSGTLIVKAFKKVDTDEKLENGKDRVMTTPGTSWKFSTLVLSVGRNEKRKVKNAKTVNLLNNGNLPLV